MRDSWHSRFRTLGYTLVELLITLALVSVLLSLFLPDFSDVLLQTKINKAVSDIRVLDYEITAFARLNDRTPDALELLPLPIPPDPWGNPYMYQVQRGPGWRGSARKDRFLVPLNNDYDLYSRGPDGESRPPLANPMSHDDIVRAADGAYFGPAHAF